VLEGTVQVADTVAQRRALHNPNVKKYTYDQAAARSSSTTRVEGGCRRHPREGRREALVTALLSSADAIGKLYWQVIQQNMKTAGVDIKIDTKDAAARSQVWRSGQWEIQISRWVLPPTRASPSLFVQGLEQHDRLLRCGHGRADDPLRSGARPAKRKAYCSRRRAPRGERVLAADLLQRQSDRDEQEARNFKASGTNLGSFWNVFEWYLNK